MQKVIVVVTGQPAPSSVSKNTVVVGTFKPKENEDFFDKLKITIPGMPDKTIQELKTE